MKMAMNFDTPSGDYSRDLEAGKHLIFRRGESEDHRLLDDDDRTIEFVASTDGIKRDGNRVRNDGWDFSNFAKNPVFLWGHDQGGGDLPPLPPIGSIQEYWVEDVDGAAGGMRGEITSRLMIRVKFAEHELAETVFNLYLQGHLRAVSIGWTPLEYEPILDDDGVQVGWDFVRSELLEISAVPVPSDPDALITAAATGVLPQGQLGQFAKALRSSRAGAYWLDGQARDNEAGETPVENVETREIDWQDGERVLKGLEDEIDKLAEAIERQDKETIENCVAQTEKLIEEHESFLHAVYDEHLAEDEPTEDELTDDELTDDEELRLFQEIRDRLRDLVEVTEAEASQAREYGPEMLDALRNLIGDLRGDMVKLKDAVTANDTRAIALEIGHAMERLGDIESILSSIYSEFIFEDDGDEAPAEEPEDTEEEVVVEEEEVEATFDELVASLDELISRQQSREVVANEASEAANLGRVADGHVNLSGAWEMTANDENAILGDPENPDWKAYASAHLGRETDAPEDTKGHYKYPIAKLQDGDLVVYVAALRAVRSYASSGGAEGVFEAAGRIIEAVKASLMDDDQAEEAVAEATVELPTRIGKKVSTTRAVQLAEAREMANGVCRILDGILADASSHEDEDSRDIDDEALLMRLGELATELGVPTEADLISRITDLADTLAAKPDTPEEFAEKLLAAE
jgi:hypothetical protein